MGFVTAAVTIATAIGTAVTGGGFAALAAISATTAFEATAAVGAVLSVVGTVTHDKTLSTVGLALGAVGGIGALASSAGVLGADAAGGGSLFGATSAPSTADAASAGTIDTIASGSAADAAVPAFASGSAADAAVPAFASGSAADAAVPAFGANYDAAGNVITSPAGANVAAGVPAGTEMAPQDATAVQNSVAAAQSGGTSQNDAVIGQTPVAAPTGAVDTSAAPPGAPVTNAPGQAGTPTSPDLISTPPQPPNNLGATDPVTGQTITQAVDQVTGKVVSLPDSSSGTLGGILSFVKSNPVVAYGVLQAGGSLLTGLTSTLTPAQVGALNAQANANNAATALQTQQTANLAMPKAVAHITPVTGAPQTLVPGYSAQSQAAGAGFINQAPVQQAQVTGKPLAAAA
jgi:hypothetical protein